MVFLRTNGGGQHPQTSRTKPGSKKRGPAAKPTTKAKPKRATAK